MIVVEPVAREGPVRDQQWVRPVSRPPRRSCRARGPDSGRSNWPRGDVMGVGPRTRDGRVSEHDEVGGITVLPWCRSWWNECCPLVPGSPQMTVRSRRSRARRQCGLAFRSTPCRAAGDRREAMGARIGEYGSTRQIAEHGYQTSIRPSRAGTFSAIGVAAMCSSTARNRRASRRTSRPIAIMRDSPMAESIE